MNLTKLAAAQSVDIDIELETADIFDHQQSIKEAKLLIRELNERSFQENTLHKQIDFSDDYWGLFNPIRGNSEDIDFTFMSQLGFYSHIKADELKIALKCWVLDRLIKDRLTASSVQTYFFHVKETITRTHIFLISEIEPYAEHIKGLPLADISKHQIVSSVLNFLSFYNNIPTVEQYTEALYRILNNLKPESKTRIIPSGMDILRFSSIVDDYFKVEDANQKDYLHYFPLLLWWRITTVIPLRPFEFCAISPDCLIYKNEKCYLKLPRLKGDKSYKRNVRRKQIVDKIQIPPDIEELIREYEKLVESYNHKTRKTLISRKVYDITLPAGESSYKRKRSNESFLSPDLQYLIERFYSNIVHRKYGLSYTHLPPVGKKSSQKDYSERNADLVRVRPIDSRHIAFINMLAQGWSKPEIARFGGHLLLETQVNYQNHQEYWIEVETRKLMQHFKLGMKISKAQEDGTTRDSFTLSVRLDSAFKKKFILRPPATSIKKPLKLGYCTDSNQLCRTVCFHCDYWRLTTEEFENRAEELKAFIAECDHTIAGLFSFLKDLNRFVFEEELNPEIAGKILSTQKKIDDEIFKRSSLLYNMERSLVK
ncbi:hypothetical protein C7121_13325 [Paenibacillus glucanolyticus]|jgi:hypothetical protein|uniref:hypothetical protein n=1 Tax=Paenibacillus glucanolyticus TaxID=59843 RepID=UPI000D1A4EE1|nr:hypothetical protein [Paenibacillus glucanolyticus]AVV57017.1 hypothetical protein C7121_13325 [Paenibacillus glucanolyticus]